MKRMLLLLCVVLLAAAFAAFLLGQEPVQNIYIAGHSLSDDGSTLQFTVGIATSMGYTRGFIDRPDAHGNHYLTFYSAWGGFNSNLGAKSYFTLPLSPEDKAVYIKNGRDYRLELVKDEQGNWIRPTS